MTRTFWILLIFPIISCSGSDDDQQAGATPEPTATATPAPSPTPTEVGETFELGNGVTMVIDADGVGEKPVADERVFFVYDLRDSTGTEIESQREPDSPMSIVLGEDRGWSSWHEALLNLREKGEATMTVPGSELDQLGFDEVISQPDQSFSLRLRRVPSPLKNMTTENETPETIP